MFDSARDGNREIYMMNANGSLPGLPSCLPVYGAARQL